MWWGIPGWALGVGIIILASTLSKALVPYFKAQAHRVAREGASDDQLAELQQRLGEVEERLDFAERMIAQQRESERLGPPKS